MRRLAAALALVLTTLPAPAPAMDKPRDWVPPPISAIPNHRELWRNVIIEIASYAKARKPDFVVVVHDGIELLVKGKRETDWEEAQDPAGTNFEKRLPDGAAFRPYLKVIDGVVVDGLYCGPYAFGMPLAQAIKERKDLDRQLAEERARGIHRPPVPQPFGPFSLDPREELRRAAEIRREAARIERQRRMVYAIDALRDSGRRVLSLDDCRDPKTADAALSGGDRDKVLVFSAQDNPRADIMPRTRPHHENPDPVKSIAQTRNWLPMLRGESFATRAEWVQAMEKTNYDMIAIDVAHRGSEGLTPADLHKLKFKSLGAPRLVLAALPLGKTKDTRWYWQKGWEAGNPPFLFAPDSDNPGWFITDLNDPDWKAQLGKIAEGIVNAGFDGIFFDEVDTYLWFEDLMPLD
jgi:endo-alpha-1,4-polygalactosaminidase (GH114 family)